MKALLLPIALGLAAAPLAAQTEAEPAPPQLSAEQTAALHCSVTFGLVAGGQDRGEAWAMKFPPMEPRGKEFFVRTMAQLMDDLSMTRDQVGAMALADLQDITANGTDEAEKAMPACLMLLDASGL
jgi:hypothetical protein